MPTKLSPSRHLRIGRSKAGLGLFARVAIKKGQFIVRYSGRKIRTEVADALD
jgi:SET domain-containing protein